MPSGSWREARVGYLFHYEDEPAPQGILAELLDAMAFVTAAALAAAALIILSDLT